MSDEWAFSKGLLRSISNKHDTDSLTRLTSPMAFLLSFLSSSSLANYQSSRVEPGGIFTIFCTLALKVLLEDPSPFDFSALL